MSIPASFRIDFTHLAMVELVTALCGLVKLINKVGVL